MKIALASPPFPKSVDDGLYWLEQLVKDAASKKAEIICFPETYIPGYHGEGYPAVAVSPQKLQQALDKAAVIACENKIAIILPMDWHHPSGLLNLAYVISNTGKILGYQTKNQLDPTEDEIWTPGTERSIFEINGVKIGITICHEGFRYPESVRWAAQQGAQIVFHPHCTGGDAEGTQFTEWASKNNTYHEKAIMLRAMENTIYFASSNYGFKYPDSASSIIAPDGTCLAYVPHGETGVIVADLDLSKANGILAKRFKNELYK
jgi:5-aminopentanamidase